MEKYINTIIKVLIVLIGICVFSMLWKLAVVYLSIGFFIWLVSTVIRQDESLDIIFFWPLAIYDWIKKL